MVFVTLRVSLSNTVSDPPFSLATKPARPSAVKAIDRGLGPVAIRATTL